MLRVIRLFVLALLLVAAVAGVVLVGYIRLTGLSALPQPGGVEARTARALRALAVPPAVRGMPNPVPASPEVIEAGLVHFADHCASCHANDGSGNVSMGQKLYPKAPDMRTAITQGLSDGELFWIIENGVRFTGMPGWATGTSEGERESWELVHFIRHLPKLTDEEQARMAARNPRSMDEVRQQLEEERFLRGESLP